MNVYVLTMFDAIGNNGSSIHEVLGAYKTKKLAQAKMKKNYNKDVASAKERNEDCEKEIGNDSALISFSYDDYILYEIHTLEIEEGK